MKIFATLLTATFLTSTLTSCGYTRTDRTASGALIGLGAGVVTAAAIGSGVGAGALVGVGAGAALGATTYQHELDFGEPIWGR